MNFTVASKVHTSKLKSHEKTSLLFDLKVFLARRPNNPMLPHCQNAMTVRHDGWNLLVYRATRRPNSKQKKDGMFEKWPSEEIRRKLREIQTYDVYSYRVSKELEVRTAVEYELYHTRGVVVSLKNLLFVRVRTVPPVRIVWTTRPVVTRNSHQRQSKQFALHRFLYDGWVWNRCRRTSHGTDVSIDHEGDTLKVIQLGELKLTQTVGQRIANNNIKNLVEYHNAKWKVTSTHNPFSIHKSLRVRLTSFAQVYLHACERALDLIGSSCTAWVTCTAVHSIRYTNEP
eukprot:184306-Prorocentrum_minimum.AAC.3